MKYIALIFIFFHLTQLSAQSYYTVEKMNLDSQQVDYGRHDGEAQAGWDKFMMVVALGGLVSLWAFLPKKNRNI